MSIVFEPLPFEEAIAFFKSKIVMTPDQYAQLAAAARARAFSVSGVTRLSVLEDLYAALGRGIAEGVSWGDFKRSVKETMARRGWEGLNPFRLETVFRQNVQSAYQAGHYRQMTEASADRPYWQYVAVMDSRTRPAHAAMNGKVFRSDDPFWSRNFPPNGFNCRCTVRSLSDREIRRDGLTVEDGGPDIADKGWDTNPAETWTHGVMNRLSTASPALAVAAFAEIGPSMEEALRKEYQEWIKRVRADAVVRGRFFNVGVMSEEDLAFLTGKGHQPETAAITLHDRVATGKKEKRHQLAGDALTEEEWLLVPDFVASAQAVLWDIRHQSVLYVAPSLTDPRKIKIVVRPNYKSKGITANETTTVFKVQIGALMDPESYQLIRGSLR